MSKPEMICGSYSIWSRPFRLCGAERVDLIPVATNFLTLGSRELAL